MPEFIKVKFIKRYEVASKVSGRIVHSVHEFDSSIANALIDKGLAVYLKVPR